MPSVTISCLSKYFLTCPYLGATRNHRLHAITQGMVSYLHMLKSADITNYKKQIDPAPKTSNDPTCNMPRAYKQGICPSLILSIKQSNL